MTDSPSDRSGGRLRGCLLAGCAVVVLLLLVPPILLWAFARSVEENAQPPRDLTRRHALPATGTGRLELDVRMADLTIEPAPAGSPLRLEAHWDPSRFRLEEGLRPTADGWTYRLRIAGRGLRTWLPVGNQGHTHGPELRLWVPADRPLAITGEVGMGRSSLELGGLALSSLDLELGMGEHTLSFSSPVTTPVSRLALDASMGEIEVLLAGNASPRELAIEHGMGELRLDLGGRWRNDGRVDLSLGMGNCQVALPDREEAGALVEKGRVRMGSRSIDDLAESELVPGMPVVRIRAEGGMGELVIR
jgi:hypothetical protein